MSINSIVESLYRQEQVQQVLAGILNYGIARYTSDTRLREQLLEQQKINLPIPEKFAQINKKISLELIQKTPETIIIQATYITKMVSCFLYLEKIEKKEESSIVYTIEYK